MNLINISELTSEEILAQCLLFFFAAYDTTSSALAFFLYSMAENPEIQEKVYREIQDVMTECVSSCNTYS